MRRAPLNLMFCSNMQQPGSAFNHKLQVQPEMTNLPPDKAQSMGLYSDADMETLLAGAGYNVKAADLELVAQRLEQLDSLFTSQDGGALSLSHLSSEAVHYNPSDMASWLDCMIEEIGPSTSSSVLLGAGGVPQSMEGNAFLPNLPMHYALQGDPYGLLLSSSTGGEGELCVDQQIFPQKAEVRAAFEHCPPRPSTSTSTASPLLLQQHPTENGPSISQLIKDAIGHNGAPSASRNGQKGFSNSAIPKEDTADMQRYKIVEDQASSNQMVRLYSCGPGDRSQQSPTSSSGFSSGFKPHPRRNSMSSLQQQQHVTSIDQSSVHGNSPLHHQMRQACVAPAPASSQGSNSRGPYQETPPPLHIPQPYQVRQDRADLRVSDAKVRSVSPSSSPRDKESHGFRMHQSPDKVSRCQTLQMGTCMDINDDGIAQESGIKLVHLLMACAEAVHNSELAAAVDMVREIKRLASSTSGAMSKVASHFADALARRIYPGSSEEWAYLSQADNISELLYNNFYEAFPYLKFAHFTANQAILEAFQGHKSVHVIDFNLMQGLQWPALIQALAIRQGGPPQLRMTGIGLPHPDSKDVLQEIGMKLAQLAESVNVEFSFRGMVATKLDDVKPWYFEVKQGEVIAVNSIFQLHRLLYGHTGSDPSRAPIDEVLRSIKSLKPKVVTVVEQEANHNSDVFLKRFVEALHYYSTMFDSLEACSLHPKCPEMAWTEMYLAREIANIVACEGLDRVERHEPLSQWQKRMLDAGFRPLHLGSNAFEQGSMLLKLFSGEGYTMEEKKGCITLGWHSRPLIAASAWQCG